MGATGGIGPFDGGGFGTSLRIACGGAPLLSGSLPSFFEVIGIRGDNKRRDHTVAHTTFHDETACTTKPCVGTERSREERERATIPSTRYDVHGQCTRRDRVRGAWQHNHVGTKR
ncbi:hypothetical protein M8J75_001377 [Diaphorina citri]|nr:hypothetical protein M8J75_001377 [Diaphorina citri]